MHKPTVTRSAFVPRHGAGAYGSFDAEGWLRAFTKASRARDGGALRSLRVEIIEDTVRCCEQLHYLLLSGDRVTITTAEALEETVKACQMHTLREFSTQLRARRHEETKFEVVEGDCLEAAIDLKLGGLNPAVLNMASARRPGGGYKHGAGAQEENLFRRSNYYQSLEDPDRIDDGRRWSYPMRDCAGVYSPSVQVFRAAEAKGYEFLPAPVALDFIAVAAFSHPLLVTSTVNGRSVLRLAPEVVKKTKDKIRLIFYMALQHGHDALVLSAFGCGAFCNPPDHMAELFREVIDQEFSGCFKHISFAIFDDHNSRKPHNPEGNVLPFKRVFGVVTAADEEAAAAASAAAAAAPPNFDSRARRQAAAAAPAPPPASETGRGTGRGTRNARVAPGGGRKRQG